MEYKQDGFRFTKIPFLNYDALCVQSSKIDETTEYIKKNHIKYIILNSEYGYRSKNVDFLEKIADQIIGINIEIDVKDISPLNCLLNLKYLSITEVQIKQVIDFSNFHSLVECNILWSENIQNLDSCKKLKKLTVWSFNKINLWEFKNIISLESLSLYECPLLTNLDGIENLINIRDLLLYKCGKLTSIEKIKYLSNTLTDLSIIKTKDLNTYSPISELNKLKNLTITDSGSTPNSKFLESLGSLQYGNINIDIIDGKVDNILQLPIKFKNYHHFSHKNIHQLKMDSEGNYVLVRKNNMSK